MKVNNIKPFFSNTLSQSNKFVRNSQNADSLIMSSIADFCEYFENKRVKLFVNNKPVNSLVMSSFDDFCKYFDSKLF